MATQVQKLKFLTRLTRRDMITLRTALIQMQDSQRWTDGTIEIATKILKRLEKVMNIKPRRNHAGTS